MPTVRIHPPPTARSWVKQSGLPQLFHTPSGFAMLEIQGSVNASETGADAQQDGTREALEVGKLVFPLHDSSKPADDTSWHRRVYLYVGKYQRLTGEVKKLSKPIAVLRRRSSPGSTGTDSDDLEIAEIVHYKLLFAHRPEPVGGVGG